MRVNHNQRIISLLYSRVFLVKTGLGSFIKSERNGRCFANVIRWWLRRRAICIWHDRVRAREKKRYLYYIDMASLRDESNAQQVATRCNLRDGFLISGFVAAHRVFILLEIRICGKSAGNWMNKMRLVNFNACKRCLCIENSSVVSPSSRLKNRYYTAALSPAMRFTCHFHFHGPIPRTTSRRNISLRRRIPRYFFLSLLFYLHRYNVRAC